MKKRIIIATVLFINIILLLTQCTYHGADDSIDNTESRYYSAIYGAYNNECSVAFFEFANILDSLGKCKNSDDITYIKGRIDGYTSRGTFMYSLIQENIKQTKNPILDTDFSESVFEALKYMHDYLTKINDILAKKDIDTLSGLKSEFDELHSLTTKFDINNTLYNNKSSKTEDVKIINQIIKIFTSSKIFVE